MKMATSQLPSFSKKNRSIQCFSFSSASSNIDEQQTQHVKFPLSTKVVICGGGLFGTSVAYHLAQLGYKDVVLVTRDKYGYLIHIFFFI